jgi:hypothetical protein
MDPQRIHRFVLHNLTPTQHALHHANPDEPVLPVFRQIWVCFALVYSIAGGAFLAGALIAYAWYLFVHHCAHRPGNLPLPLLKHHRSHHRFATRNYGVSNKGPAGRADGTSNRTQARTRYPVGDYSTRCPARQPISQKSASSRVASLKITTSSASRAGVT